MSAALTLSRLSAAGLRDGRQAVDLVRRAGNQADRDGPVDRIRSPVIGQCEHGCAVNPPEPAGSLRVTLNDETAVFQMRK